jgi:hypothetical protein
MSATTTTTTITTTNPLDNNIMITTSRDHLSKTKNKICSRRSYIGLDSDRNDKFVVLQIKNVVMHRLTGQFLIDRIQRPSFRLNELSFLAQHGSDGFLNASEFQSANSSTCQKRCKDKMVVGGNNRQWHILVGTKSNLKPSPSRSQDD